MREALGDRGKAIWDAYGADALPAGSRALIHEAARIADTLDRLALLAAGDVDTWVTLKVDEVGEVTLAIDSILAERRQQQIAFKQIMSEIRTAGIKQAATSAKKDETEGRGGVILKLRDRAG
jgi:hypothetical protein